MSAVRFARLAGFALAVIPLFALACEGHLHAEILRMAAYALDCGAIVAQQPRLRDYSNDLFAQVVTSPKPAHAAQAARGAR